MLAAAGGFTKGSSYAWPLFFCRVTVALRVFGFPVSRGEKNAAASRRLRANASGRGILRRGDAMEGSFSGFNSVVSLLRKRELPGSGSRMPG